MIFLYFLKYDEDEIFIFCMKTCMQILESDLCMKTKNIFVFLK